MNLYNVGSTMYGEADIENGNLFDLLKINFIHFSHSVAERNGIAPNCTDDFLYVFFWARFRIYPGQCYSLLSTIPTFYEPALLLWVSRNSYP